jgi:hypothetical protein
MVDVPAIIKVHQFISHGASPNMIAPNAHSPHTNKVTAPDSIPHSGKRPAGASTLDAPAPASTSSGPDTISAPQVPVPHSN